MTVSFFVPGEPVAQGRPRMTTINGRPRMFDAPKSANYKALVAMLASKEMDGREPMVKPVEVVVTIYKPVPQSWSKKRRMLALAGQIHPVGRPDIDNYIKAAFDGLNQIVFQDDRLVTKVTATKMYSTTPGLSVVAKELE